MVRKHYKKTTDWIAAKRHRLLLISTLLVLLLPAFSGSGILSEILFAISMNFLLLQSTIAAQVRISIRKSMKFLAVLLIILFSLKPAGIVNVYLQLFQFFLLVSFFIVVCTYLARFVIRSSKVTFDVLLTAINIYLILGIISASIAFLFNETYDSAYVLPSHITDPRFVTFLYYSFITLTTVGYGDIIPKIPQAQVLAYMTSITGQLYMAIAIAFLVGKFLVHSDNEHKKQSSV